MLFLTLFGFDKRWKTFYLRDFLVLFHVVMLIHVVIKQASKNEKFMKVSRKKKKSLLVSIELVFLRSGKVVISTWNWFVSRPKNEYHENESIVN